MVELNFNTPEMRMTIMIINRVQDYLLFSILREFDEIFA